MEKENTLRLLRRICMAFLAVYLVLALCAPVLAEEAAPALDAAESGAAEQTDDYAAVQAQLEAVARNEGREIAGQMLFESLRAISPAEVPQAETEPSAEPAAASGGTPSVVVHAEPRVSWSFSGLLPFLVVVAATAGVLVVFSAISATRPSKSTAGGSWTYKIQIKAALARPGRRCFFAPFGGERRAQQKSPPKTGGLCKKNRQARRPA